MRFVHSKKERPFYAMVQYSVNQYGYSGAGLSARRLMQETEAIPEVDATGFNCGIGPGTYGADCAPPADEA